MRFYVHNLLIDFFSFNSRTRKGCDGGALMLKAFSEVSIHAPARGAIFFMKEMHEKFMFQFTHPQGVRLAYTPTSNMWYSFNSRTRKGCDGKFLDVFRVAGVSIHAPARGAMNLRSIPVRIDLFQFTHPQGVRFF